ncbi:hypothetical protein [Candidatus Poriferisodalis sp.]|uniref:hypothetical protein n=1 Tax=Candidatus Poriferisodalis sp. TaxID=3101277 RepID=UPI003AF4AC12
MCDFSVVAALPERNVAAAVELKLGAAAWPDSGEQLREGLRVLHDAFSGVGAQSTPRAYLAVGKQREQLQEFLDAEGLRLNYGSRTVPVEVIDCGSCINISAA